MRFCKLFFLSLLICYGNVKAQVQAKAAIDHIKNDGVDVAGNIVLTVTGGTSPYTYTWSPVGSISKDLTNAAIGSYTVKIKDSGTDSSYYHYNLGYKADWSNHYGTFLRNDSLIPDPLIGYTYNTAITKNTLLRNADGWAQYVIPAWTSHNLVGFIDSTAASYDGWINDIDFGFHITTGNTLYAFDMGSFIYIGSANVGDVLRIERTGSNYYYYLNDALQYSTSTNPNTKLKLKAMIMAQPLVDAGVSFNDTSSLYRLRRMNAFVNHIVPDDVDTTGDIRLDITTGTLPYTFSWTPGSYTSHDLIGVDSNFYSVKVKDGDGDSIINYYHLGFKTRWKNFYGSTFSNDTLYAWSALTPTGSASAISINELRPYKKGWTQWIAGDFIEPLMIGYLDSASAASSGDQYDFDFAFHVTYGDNLYAYSSGGFTWLGTKTKGDVFVIEKSGSTFTLKQNNSSLYTDAALNHKNYKLKALMNTDAYLAHIGASFADSTTGNPLIALADVDHLKGDGIDTAGAISMRMRGGTTPYTYAWIKPGLSTVTTKNRDNLALGTYSLRVIDNDADTVSHVYNIGYKADWGIFDGTRLRNDSLLYDGTSMSYGDFPVSITLDSLGNDSAGWAEHVTRSYVSPYVLGFLDSISVSNTLNIYDIDFAYHITTGNTLYAWHSGNFYYIGSVGEGDVMRVGRRDTLYYIQKDSMTVYSATLAITRPLQLKVQLVGPPYVTDWSFLVRTGVNFFKPCSITATITGAPDLYYAAPSTATLSITVAGGTPTYAVSWFPNLFFNTPTYNYTMLTTQVNPPTGITYYATVTDLYGCVVNRSVNVIPAPYAPLQTTPDGGYYTLTNNKMLFKFDGQYALTNLAYNVYDKANNNVTSSTSVSNSGVVNSGDNRYYLDASGLTSGQYYTLEIINEKNEKRYLRFKR